MAKTVVIDELHVTVRVPNDLSDDEAEAVRRTLAGDEFMARLERAIRIAVRALPDLTACRVSLTR
jgi:hypothetical protein